MDFFSFERSEDFNKESYEVHAVDGSEILSITSWDW